MRCTLQSGVEQQCPTCELYLLAFIGDDDDERIFRNIYRRELKRIPFIGATLVGLCSEEGELETEPTARSSYVLRQASCLIKRETWSTYPWMQMILGNLNSTSSSSLLGKSTLTGTPTLPENQKPLDCILQTKPFCVSVRSTSITVGFIMCECTFSGSMLSRSLENHYRIRKYVRAGFRGSLNFPEGYDN